MPRPDSGAHQIVMRPHVDPQGPLIPRDDKIGLETAQSRAARCGEESLQNVRNQRVLLRGRQGHEPLTMEVLDH